MNIIIVPDGFTIGTVSDEGKGCKMCLFTALDFNDDGIPVECCCFDRRSKLPCIDTVFGLIPDSEGM